LSNRKHGGLIVNANLPSNSCSSLAQQSIKHVNTPPLQLLQQLLLQAKGVGGDGGGEQERIPLAKANEVIA
jgi:hypothetical protein